MKTKLQTLSFISAENFPPSRNNKYRFGGIFNKYLMYLLFLVFPLGQLLRFRLPFFSESIKFQLLDLLVLFFVLINIFFKNKSIIKPAIFKKIFIFAGILSISFLISYFKFPLKSLLPGFFYLIRFLGYLFFGYYLSFSLKNLKINISNLLLLLGLFISLFSIIQYLFIPDTRFLYMFGWDDHYYRAIGAFLDPSFNGLILVLLYANYLFRNKIININFIVISLIFLSAVALTFSRMSYFIMFILILFWSILKLKQKKLLILFGIIFLTVILLAPKKGGEGTKLNRISSLLLKVDNYKQTINIIKNNIVFGIGYNNFRLAQKDYGYISPNSWEQTNAGAGADNSFLFVFATSGIFGFIYFIYLQSILLLNSAKNKNYCLFICLLLIIISSFSINAFFYPWVLFLIFLMLAEVSVDNGF